MTRLRPLSLLVCLALPATGLQAATPAPSPYTDGISGTELQELIGTAMQQSGVSGEAQVSPHRGYPPCDSAPSIRPQKGSWSMVTLSCEDGQSWTRHIRTSVAPKRRAVVRAAPAPQPDAPLVATLNRSLKKGAVITAQDLTLAPRPTATAEGTFSDAKRLIGKRLSKNLGEGRAVQARHLEKDWMITKDMPISIQYLSAAVSISAPGKSMENGELGDMISVRNMSSGTVLLGEVAGPQKIIVRAKTY